MAGGNYYDDPWGTEDPWDTINESYNGRQDLLANMGGDQSQDAGTGQGSFLPSDNRYTTIEVPMEGGGPAFEGSDVTSGNPTAMGNDAQSQPAPPGGLNARIDEALRNAESTDDPSYWYGKIGGDPNGGGSAWDYWLDRINRGNGSKYIRNGSLQLFQDAPGRTPNAGNNWQAPGPQQSQQIPTHATYQNPMLPFIQQMLQSLIQRDQTPIDLHAPEINPAATAYTAQRDRALATQRNSLAERAAAQGGSGTDSGAFNAAVSGAQEKAGQDTAGYTGNLIYQANQQRRTELQNLLQQAIGLGLTDQAQQIQDEMNRLNLGYNYTALQQHGNEAALMAALG